MELVGDEKQTEVEDVEKEEQEDENNDEQLWPTCDQCGAAEEILPCPNMGWICIDCKHKSSARMPDQKNTSIRCLVCQALGSRLCQSIVIMRSLGALLFMPGKMTSPGSATLLPML